MADMGFLPDVTALLDMTPADGQRMLFSATLDGDVDKLVRRYLHDPVAHAVAPSTAPVDDDGPPRAARRRTERQGRRRSPRSPPAPGRTIMFVRTKHGADRAGQAAAAASASRAGALHGGKTQAARTRTLAEFREGTRPRAGRHRRRRPRHPRRRRRAWSCTSTRPTTTRTTCTAPGRTARAGERGTVVTLVAHNQVRNTERMMRRAGVQAPRPRSASATTRSSGSPGAQPPSGIPVEPDPEPRRQRRGPRLRRPAFRWAVREPRERPAGWPLSTASTARRARASTATANAARRATAGAVKESAATASGSAGTAVPAASGAVPYAMTGAAPTPDRHDDLRRRPEEPRLAGGVR